MPGALPKEINEKDSLLKEVIQLLKTIQGTEEERKALLQEIAQIEEALFGDDGME